MFLDQAVEPSGSILLFFDQVNLDVDFLRYYLD